MTQQEIEKKIQEQQFQKIIHETDFYFAKGQKAMNQWLALEVSDQMKEDLIRLSSDYTQFLEIALISPEIEQFKNILFEIISYCDNRAKDKSKYNQYDDNRILADASVRMGNWVDGLVKFKFKHAEITGRSILNAINYLLQPQDNCTILSENHRQMVSLNLLKKDYSPAGFIRDLKKFFDGFGLKPENQDNYTYLLSSLVYAFRAEWMEDVIGLMASDGTGWQEDETNLKSDYSGLIVWNSKKPSGGRRTLDFLKEKLKDGQTFPLYYSSKDYVQYKANIVDFVTSQKELSEKNWDAKKIKHLDSNFEDYKDDNKKAYILFLAESIEKISPKPISDFKFFGNYSKPRQDNLSPIKEIENDEIVITTNTAMTIKNPNKPLNQILFGPPGTGKTYHTINEAVSIIDHLQEEILLKNYETRAKLKERFDKLLIDDWENPVGQIGFITFHQSMNYEDFIEGIKPGLTEENEVVYDIEPGIFKKLASIARDNWLDVNKGKTENLSFEDAFKKLKDDWYENPDMQIRLKREGFEYTILDFTKTSIKFKKASGGTGHTLSISTLRDYYYNKKEVRPKGVGIYYPGLLEKLKSYQPTGTPKKEEKNYVLIIDEINRGNVSQIFGELITLIEEDKRLGKDEGLEVILPYSKEKFGVPPNLYIIGTMNTADRSVEALDTALRRRFSFTEMPPKPELLEPRIMLQRLWIKYADLAWDDPLWIKTEEDFLNLFGATILDKPRYQSLESENDLNILSEKFNGVIKFEGLNLEQLLRTMNGRIQKLLNRDHLIGHSYFIRVNSWEDLENSFYRNIIPLLQEYFFGDYAKIGAVLGRGFVYSENETNVDFATGFESEDYADNSIYQIIDYRANQPGNRYIEPDMTFEKAIRLLMNQSFQQEREK